MVTFVGTSNTMVDTTTGRIQTKGIQHNSNVITDVSGPHGRVAPTLKKYPEIVFEEGKFDRNDSTNTYTQAGYTVTASSIHSDPYQPWKAFDENISNNTGWLPEFTSTNHDYSGSDFSYSPTGTSSLTTNANDVINGEWLQIKLPSKIQLSSIILHARSGNYTQVPEDFKVLGSNTGIDGSWVVLTSFVDESGAVNSGTMYDINASSYYNHYALITTQVVGDGGTNYGLSIAEWKLYGYEELATQGDHSVDTTFKSRFNNPQTTGVQVLVDGETGVGTNQISGGPDPSGNQSTYVTDGKYWTLNGTLTSNLAVEANTFLEGDQPHSVSVWFNSSNLEANVSNTCVFSISDQEKLDSVNLDLQSNTWHNLTYAYQGEGGSRVTYLDGRKVSEDQAEDTFGDYPPFEMTGYSQGGYVVSASSHHETYLPWYAFDDQTAHATSDNSWICHHTPDRYDQTSGVATSDADLTVVDGVQKRGEWIQMEFPNKMCLSYIALAPQTDTEQYRAPKEGVIAGSNDGTTWETLHAFVNQTSWTDNVFNNYVVNTNVGKGYRYVRIIVEKVQYDGTQNSNRRYTSLGEIRFYGHRENDLVRLPDPTNVLKYPHINVGFPRDTPAKRGYVVTGGTSIYSGRVPSRAFSSGDGDTWETNDNAYNLSNNGIAQTGTNTFGAYTGHWVKLKLPHKIVVSKIDLLSFQSSSTDDRRPDAGAFLGSNDDSTWDLIHVFGSGSLTWTSPSTTNANLREANISNMSASNTNAYKYIVFVITHKTYSGVTTTRSTIYEIKYYGTEEASQVPIQIGGGNIDKVANFRVYDKFIDQNQALEIWDAQKDEFGRVKSSMTLQKGRLGIGTTEPEGRLAVLDEPHNLEEFPPRAMTGYETYFEGHGEFCASASSYYSSGSDERLAWKAFNKNPANSSTGWQSGNDYNGATSGTASGNTPTYGGNESLHGINGESISLKFPYKVKLNRLKITSYFDGTFRGLNDGFLLGRNDKNSEWTRVYEITNLYAVYGVRDTAQLSAEISFTNDDYYNEYALIATSTTGHSNWTALELRYFGTREQGQSVLHDGQLTLTKNLDVPRIGPPLDADDTPRRDRLVVEYNTSSNPTFEGAVRDTSGRGNDGVFVNQTHYDATERALVFDGTDDRILSRLQNPAGESLFSGSLWYKPAGSGNEEDFVWIGTHASGKAFIFKYNSPNFEFSFYGNDAIFNYTLNAGTWYHLAFAYSGGTASSGRRIWVNGVEVAYTSGASSTALNLDANAQLMIGDRTDNGGDLYGSISNFKLYDCALTAQEVKTLYDMGRNGSVANPQPLHISGPVNVMGDIRYITSRPLALPTMWDHMSNGHFTRGVYPIVGTQGGGKVYNVYCEPDLAGGGWMCMAQISKNGYQTRAHPTNGDLDLFTKEFGDSKNIRWDNTFSVPINILSNNSGYDLDVMVYVSGGTNASRYEGGMRLGAVWRGVNLSQALDPGVTGGHIGRSGLASSSDGYTFSSRTPVDNEDYGLVTSSGWYYNISASSGKQGAYNDFGYSDGGWIIHSGSVANHAGSIYGGLHKDDGTAENMSNSTNWVCARIFVRPSVY